MFILRKEFLQIRRNRTMLPIIFVVPFVQLLILVHAATFEMKHIRMHVIDHDMSSVSREIISKFQGSPFYEITNFSFSDQAAEEDLKKDKTDIILVIPAHFEKKLRTENKVKVQFIVNAINAAAAGLTYAYSTSILLDYNLDLVAKWANIPASIQSSAITTTSSFLYNPELNYKNFGIVNKV